MNALGEFVVTASRLERLKAILEQPSHVDIDDAFIVEHSIEESWCPDFEAYKCICCGAHIQQSHYPECVCEPHEEECRCNPTVHKNLQDRIYHKITCPYPNALWKHAQENPDDEDLKQKSMVVSSFSSPFIQASSSQYYLKPEKCRDDSLPLDDLAP